MRYFVRISYLGCSFHGFQFQPNRRTVQGELNRACRELFGVDCAVTGCSRTDSGVHAEDFCATLDVPDSGVRVPPFALPRAIAQHLPADICLFHAEEADETFHARYDVREKEYVYRILLSPLRDPFWQGRAWQYPYPLLKNALELMQQAGNALVGTHDFAAYKNDDGTVKNTVRTVTAMHVNQEGNQLLLSVSADGFLYNMVRIITGTLMDVAVGHMTVEDVVCALKSGQRKKSGVTAPPDGLYLHKVTYLRPPSFTD